MYRVRVAGRGDVEEGRPRICSNLARLWLSVLSGDSDSPFMATPMPSSDVDILEQDPLVLLGAFCAVAAWLDASRIQPQPLSEGEHYTLSTLSLMLADANDATGLDEAATRQGQVRSWRTLRVRGSTSPTPAREILVGRARAAVFVASRASPGAAPPLRDVTPSPAASGSWTTQVRTAHIWWLQPYDRPFALPYVKKGHTFVCLYGCSTEDASTDFRNAHDAYENLPVHVRLDVRTLTRLRSLPLDGAPARTRPTPWTWMRWMRRCLISVARSLAQHRHGTVPVPLFDSLLTRAGRKRHPLNDFRRLTTAEPAFVRGLLFGTKAVMGYADSTLGRLDGAARFVCERATHPVYERNCFPV